eukprot:TRINITY_DN5125_c0_g1_i1.p1 TRINITY_DN5125_c0_g1~~TRINITY_DN5125_c0_g1_i1.p1  ORF type:complete len:397 (+),score=129.54 TRINITY_DN5125_c0_g1_i1:64-1191(+)
MAWLRGLLLLLVMLVSALVGSVALLPPLLLLLPIPGARPLFHFLASTVAEQWFLLVSLMLETVGGLSCRVWLPEGCDIPADRAFIISNHRTRIDWMLAWPVLARLPGRHLHKLRIALRADMKHLPAFGWAMQYFRFLFIERSTPAQALSAMRASAGYFADHGETTSVFIFPEGTDLSASGVKRSHAFSEERGLPKLNHVLWPKPSGTRVLLERLAPSVDRIWDLTMGYKDYTPGERPSEKSLLRGRVPREIHVLIEPIRKDAVPMADEAAFKNWMNDRFTAKEKKLADFYGRQDDVGFAANGRVVPLPMPVISYLGAVAFWVLLGAPWMYYCATSWWVFLESVAVVVLYIVARTQGGLDRWLIGSTPPRPKTTRE